MRGWLAGPDGAGATERNKCNVFFKIYGLSASKLGGSENVFRLMLEKLKAKSKKQKAKS
jgi:hypothetical protein